MDFMLKIKSKGLGVINGPMVEFMKVIGIMENNMEKVNLLHLRVNAKLDYGKMDKK